VNDAEMSAAGTSAASARQQDMDLELVRQYLGGDSRAFEALFKKYQTPMFNLVNRMVGGEDAYDLTQDVFCNALRAIHTFRGESKFSTWLYSIAKNVCLNRIRSRANKCEESLDGICEDHPRAEIADSAPNPQSIAEMHELQRTVDLVLETLSPDQRLMIVLRDFEQLSYEEIGEITGTSLPNVKSRLHRARMAFKNKFKPFIPLIREDII
jgi:RNA polymerase sigma-70 factor (ECF subfamily)